MGEILSFNDLASLDQSTMGVGSAGLAVVARGGLATVRGFIVPPVIFKAYLNKEKVANALEKFRSLDDEKESRKLLGAAFLEERIQWGDEMDLVVAFRELDGTVAVTTTTRLGTDQSEVYADNEVAFLETVKDCWLRWVLGYWKAAEEAILPALTVREVPDAEVSVDLRKKESGVHARVVFGLPAGLTDTTVSPDIVEFDPAGTVLRREHRTQEWQYVLGKRGVVRTAVAPDFQDEEKVTDETVESLKDIMTVMSKASKMDACQVCFVADKPLVYSATLIPEARSVETAIPHRGDSLTLLSPKSKVAERVSAGPVVAAKLLLNIYVGNELDAVKTGMDGIIFTSRFMENAQDWRGKAREIAEEANRRFGSTRVAFTIGSERDAGVEDIVSVGGPLTKLGARVSVVMPASRHSDELKEHVGRLGGILRRNDIEYWQTVRYPSNLFFLDELVDSTDALALDIETLSMLLTGKVEDDDGWLNYSLPALRKAYSEIIGGALGKEKTVAVLTPNLVGTPSLLEFLVREGAEILCVDADDLSAVRHIVASIEKRMLLEMGVEGD